MTEEINLGEDDGFVVVKTADGECRLDLFQTQNKIHDYHKANANKPEEEYAAGLVTMMQSMGLPRGSHRMAIRFVQSINARVAEVKKKDAPLPV